MKISKKTIIFTDHAKQRAKERGLKLSRLLEQRIRNGQRRRAQSGMTQRVFARDRWVLNETNESTKQLGGEIVAITRESAEEIVVITAYERKVFVNSLQSQQKQSGLRMGSLTLTDKATANRLSVEI